MPVGMGGMTGIQATALMRHELPETRILILTVHDDGAYVRHAIQAGAVGYILKDTNLPLELGKAIRVVHEGGRYFGPGLDANNTETPL